MRSSELITPRPTPTGIMFYLHLLGIWRYYRRNKCTAQLLHYKFLIVFQLDRGAMRIICYIIRIKTLRNHSCQWTPISANLQTVGTQFNPFMETLSYIINQLMDCRQRLVRELQCETCQIKRKVAQ